MGMKCLLQSSRFKKTFNHYTVKYINRLTLLHVNAIFLRKLYMWHDIIRVNIIKCFDALPGEKTRSALEEIIIQHLCGTI